MNAGAAMLMNLRVQATRWAARWAAGGEARRAAMKGLAGVLNTEFTGGDGGAVWHVSFDDGRVVMRRGAGESRRATRRLRPRDCPARAAGGLAHRLGYDCVCEVEHHGLYEYSHSSPPEIFLSFVAARTQRIRVRHGITLTPHRYNHPIRVAERIATLDILSGGRVNWGSGKSSSLVEKVAFQNDLTTLHEQWREALEMIPRMWQQDVFTWKGRFYDIAPTQVIPKPVQR